MANISEISTFGAQDGPVHQTVAEWANGAGQVYKTVRTSLTSAQVLALNTTPVELVPAPGADKFIVVSHVFGVIDFNSAAYATNTDVVVEYSGGTDIATFTGALAATADSVFSGPGVNDAVEVENQSIQVREGGGNPATGDSPIDIYVTYAEVSFKS